ncbi:hypothetical protein [Cupriavidus pauculus]|uniref:Cellulose biosynthesis protein BcsF n=1 Tax=Cupriavidus pauculus TaxID=82633 RepID=A0A3G8H0H9_9BURK|nr:hypothetical protein [Cupriavidus pauculus]AZG14013.1 hypothetical protein EHF44_11490 [Cupriavidus pauculus]
MAIFLGYFIWGLILAAPLAWLAWRFDLLRWLPRWSAPRPRRAVRLPPQLDALVIRGKRQGGTGGRR